MQIQQINHQYAGYTNIAAIGYKDNKYFVFSDKSYSENSDHTKQAWFVLGANKFNQK